MSIVKKGDVLAIIVNGDDIESLDSYHYALQDLDMVELSKSFVAQHEQSECAIGDWTQWLSENGYAVMPEYAAFDVYQDDELKVAGGNGTPKKGEVFRLVEEDGHEETYSDETLCIALHEFDLSNAATAFLAEAKDGYSWEFAPWLVDNKYVDRFPCIFLVFPDLDFELDVIIEAFTEDAQKA